MPTLTDFSFLLVTQAKDIQRLIGVYNSVRYQYPDNEIVIVYEQNPAVKLNTTDRNLIEVHADRRVYVTEGYNLALKNSTRDCFVFIHDDTYIAKNFIENIIPHISEKQFCNFTTVEPPIYNDPDTPGKPIKDFGRDAKTFDLKAFNSFCETHISKLQTTVIESPFGGFFMAGYRSSILSVGGFDEYFKPYFHEDADLMIRLHQAGYKFVQVLNSLVYHMGSLTSRGTDESVLAHNTTRDLFIKKWKVPFDYIKHYTLLNGIPYKKMPIEIECKNCARDFLNFVDLINEKDSDIKISVDQTKMTNQDFEYIQTLPYVLQSIEEPGDYELGNLKVKYRKK